MRPGIGLLHQRAIMQALKVTVCELKDSLSLEDVKARCLALGNCQLTQAVTPTQDSSLTVVFASEVAVLQSLFAQHFGDTLQVPGTAYSFQSVEQPEEVAKSRSRSRSPAGPTNVSVSTEEAKPVEEQKAAIEPTQEPVSPEETKSLPTVDVQTPPAVPKPELKQGAIYQETDGSKWILIRKKADDDRTQLQCQACKKLILKRSLPPHLESKTHKTNCSKAAK